MREGAAFTFHGVGGGGGGACNLSLSLAPIFMRKGIIFLFSKGKETDIFGQIKEVHFSPGEGWVAQLVAHLAVSEAVLVRIQASLKNPKWSPYYVQPPPQKKLNKLLFREELSSFSTT